MKVEDALSARFFTRRTTAGDVFERAQSFAATRALRRSGLYPFFQAIEADEGPLVRIRGREVLMLGSNDYLGLSKHPRVKAAAVAAIGQWGTSCTGSRLLNGSRTIHADLEGRLAEFLGHEEALVFATGYQTGLGALSALMAPTDTAFLDEFTHASAVDGVRLGRAKLQRFRHNDVADLERKLDRLERAAGGALIVVDGVYGMEGDIADLPPIVEAAKRVSARVVVDDAHGLGVLGSEGRGTAAQFGVVDGVDLTVATFSKTLASVGGVLAGPHEVVEMIRHTARSMLFSASLPPACVATVDAALTVLQEEPGLRERLARNARYWRDGLRGLGFEVALGDSPIVPLRVGNEVDTLSFWTKLLEHGVYVSVALAPATPRDRPLLRSTVMATLTIDHLDRALEAARRSMEEIAAEADRGPSRPAAR